MSLLAQTIKDINPVDEEIQAVVQKRLDNLTKPPGSLGVLEDLIKKIASIRGEEPRRLLKKRHILLAGDHGVVQEGVSAYPQEVTSQMVLNFIRGGAAINVLARHAGVDLVLVDIGVASSLPDAPGLLKKKIAYGTENFTRGPAMTREQAVRSLEIGIEVAAEEIAKGAEILGIGEMGIGNTTPSTAILAVFSRLPIEEIVGRGTGIDDHRLELKIKAIQKGIRVNSPAPEDPIDVLAKVGGFEIGGMAGVILGAAARRVPVVIDGFISSAAALLAVRLCPKVKDYLIASHLSEEPGHRVMLDMMGLTPMLTMRMRLGEGTGALLALTIIDAALKIYNEMATFAEAGVSGALD